MTVAVTSNRPAGLLALAAGAAGIAGVFATWLRISVAGATPPGSAETGWEGRDGKTVAIAAGVGILAGLGLALFDRRELALKAALLVTGGVTLVIGLVNLADAQSKPNDLHVRFGIDSSDVGVHVGVGLWLAVVAGCGLLAAGLAARRQ